MTTRKGRLEGKVALLTGSGAGIGKRAAQLFAEEGARVVIAEINETAGQQTVREIEAAGGKAIFCQTDVTEADSVQAAVAAAVKHFGKLNIIHNNVGGTSPKDGPVTTVDLDVFWLTMKRDLYGTLLGCRFAIPEIIKAGGGSVINMSSLVALMGKPAPSQVCYSAAKGAIISMTRAMAVEYAPQKVRVNAIAPGLTLTERIAARVGDHGFIPKVILDRHLLGPCEPEDIAQAVLYLASDAARMVTGHTLPVDSGITMS